MKGQGAPFEHGIIHNPTWIGQGSGDMEMRHFLSTYTSRNRVPWEDKDRKPDYDQWEGKFPPFETIETLGKSPTATVDRVRSLKCGIVMARKLINCEPKQRKALARTEIKCLKDLRHPHIVAMVGTYLDGKSVGILLYPAAEWNLEQFMVDVPDRRGETQRCRLRSYFVCLAQAVRYLHDLNIRHKDIKPTNILVDSFGNVLLADFGISLKARDKAHLITQSNTNRSYGYCSPEIIAKRKRYPSSDVFSLGAVFAEMTTVVLNRPLTEFRKFRESRDEDKSFHRNLDKVEIWMNLLAKPLDGEKEDGRHDEMIKAIPTILSMLAYRRNAPRGTDSGIDRPSVSSLWESFQNVSSYICHDCDPRQPSPWKHEPLPEEERDLDWPCYFQDLSQESLNNSLQGRETYAATRNTSRPTDSHDDRQGPDERKTEILYNPQTQTLKMVPRAEIEELHVKQEDLPTFAHKMYINRGDDTYTKIILRGLGMRVNVKRLFGRIKYIYILRGPDSLNNTDQS